MSFLHFSSHSLLKVTFFPCLFTFLRVHWILLLPFITRIFFSTIIRWYFLLLYSFHSALWPFLHSWFIRHQCHPIVLGRQWLQSFTSDMIYSYWSSPVWIDSSESCKWFISVSFTSRITSYTYISPYQKNHLYQLSKIGDYHCNVKRILYIQNLRKFVWQLEANRPLPTSCLTNNKHPNQFMFI